jgi:hypothetical protein
MNESGSHLTIRRYKNGAGRPTTTATLDLPTSVTSSRHSAALTSVEYPQSASARTGLRWG